MSIGSLPEAYSRLDGFRRNMPETATHIKENYINEYHQIVDILETVIQKPLQGFRIQSSELARMEATFDSESEQCTYTNEYYCEKAMLLMKVDALIVFLSTSANSSEKRRIGF